MPPQLPHTQQALFGSGQEGRHVGWGLCPALQWVPWGSGGPHLPQVLRNAKQAFLSQKPLGEMWGSPPPNFPHPQAWLNLSLALVGLWTALPRDLEFSGLSGA